MSSNLYLEVSENKVVVDLKAKVLICDTPLLPGKVKENQPREKTEKCDITGGA